MPAAKRSASSRSRQRKKIRFERIGPPMVDDEASVGVCERLARHTAGRVHDGDSRCGNRAAIRIKGTHFNEKELCDLTLAVAAINAWDRLPIAARTVPGTYKAPQRQQRKTGT